MSKPKRPSLDVAELKAAAGSQRLSVIDPEPVSEPTPTTKAQPSRVGTKAITAHFPPDVRQQLKALGVERDETVQNLIAEALNDLFVKYGKPEIAPCIVRK